MDTITTHSSQKPTINVDSKATLDIKLEGWPGTTAVGILGAVAIVICGLFLKYKR